VASDLKTILADPDFAKLTDDDKRMVIATVDPTFLDLPDDDQSEIFTLSTPGVKRNISQVPAEEVTRVLGNAPTREEAGRLAATRLIEKERLAGMPPELVGTPEGGFRVLGEGKRAAMISFLRGAAEGGTLGLSEIQRAIQERALLKAGLTPEEIESAGMSTIDRQYPVAREIGMDASMLIPFGAGGKIVKAGAVKATAPVLSKIKSLFKAGGKGAGVAGIFGASEEAAKEIREEGTIRPAEVGFTGVGTAPIGFAFGALGGSAKLKRNPNKPLLKLADVIHPSTQAELSKWIEARDSGEAMRTLRMVRREGKPKTLKEFQEITQATQEKLGKAIDEVVEIDPDVKLGTTSILQRSRAIAKEKPLEGEGQIILEYASNNFGKTLTLKQAVTRQRQLNKQLLTYLKDANWDVKAAEANPAYIARDIARRELSKLIDAEMQRLTGTTSNPYRDYGRVHELNTQLQKRYDRLESQADILAGRGPMGELIATAESVTSLSGKGRLLQKIAATLSGGEKGRIDHQVARIFDKRLEPLPPTPTAPAAYIKYQIAERAAEIEAETAKRAAEIEAEFEKRTRAMTQRAQRERIAQKIKAERFEVQEKEGQLFIQNKYDPSNWLGPKVDVTKGNRARLAQIASDLNKGKRKTWEGFEMEKINEDKQRALEQELIRRAISRARLGQ